MSNVTSLVPEMVHSLTHTFQHYQISSVRFFPPPQGVHSMFSGRPAIIYKTDRLWYVGNGWRVAKLCEARRSSRLQLQVNKTHMARKMLHSS